MQKPEVTTRVLYRKLAMKSKLGFGKFESLTVQDILKIGKAEYLFWIYYNASNIDFLPEVKEAVGITVEIDKPGKDETLFRRLIGEMRQARKEELQASWDAMTEEERKMRRFKKASIKKARKKRKSNCLDIEQKLREQRNSQSKAYMQAKNQGKI